MYPVAAERSSDLLAQKQEAGSVDFWIKNNGVQPRNIPIWLKW